MREAFMFDPEAVYALTGLSRATIYRRMRAGIFPPPVIHLAKLCGWYERDIMQWLAARETLTPRPGRKRREDRYTREATPWPRRRPRGSNYKPRQSNVPEAALC
jgi:predicted DNA-binding transcriptional regulator AlpA